ncbi:MAG: hypothetical protein LBQ59_00495 [Candidatus Peribacteria bacterium]|jgi:hypothetical protein|nr:hypothetical protein [Candidatus Peribacteria bacterium]
MLIKNVVNTKKMYFEVKEVPDLLEFEPYTDEEYKDLLNNKNIKKNIKKLEKLLP